MKIFVALLLSFCVLFSVQAQETSVVKVVYNLDFQVDSTDSNSRLTEKMILYTDGQRSKFASEYNLQYCDSIKALMIQIFETTGKLDFSSLTINHSKFNWQIFKEKNGLVVYDDIFGETYKYLENSAIKWEIMSEKQAINGYMCQKATCHLEGRDYIAWFSKDIPISDGPYKFRGLPGLIVKVNDIRNHYNFELIAVKSNQVYDLWKMPESYTISTKKEVMEMYQYKRENPLQYISQMAAIDQTPEDKNRIIEKAKRYNNPIALEL